MAEQKDNHEQKTGSINEIGMINKAILNYGDINFRNKLSIMIHGFLEKSHNRHILKTVYANIYEKLPRMSVENLIDAIDETEHDLSILRKLDSLYNELVQIDDYDHNDPNEIAQRKQSLQVLNDRRSIYYDDLIEKVINKLT